jgi:hypothetical protein
MPEERSISATAESGSVRGPGQHWSAPRAPIDPLDELELLAGFDVWLARHDVAPARRRVYHAHAKRFLRWQAGGPAPYPDCTLSRYTRLLVRDDVGGTDLAMVATALSLLARYRIIAPRAAWTRPPRVERTRHGVAVVKARLSS